MSPETWAAFCVTEAVLCFTPGPAVLLVVSVALGRGFRPGLGASLGILSANTLYFALSATGVAAALVASRELFVALKVCGGAYLVWLGLRLILSAGSRATGPRCASEPAERAALPGRSFLRGFVVQGANPKVLAFFVALLPQFIDPHAPLSAQVLVLGASSVTIELVALATYAWVAVHVGRVAGSRVVSILERLGGGLLVAAGARLATARPE